MKTPALMTVVATLVVAVSLGAPCAHAHADGTNVVAMPGGGELADRADEPENGSPVEASAANALAGELATLGPFGDRRFDVDRAGRDIGPYAHQLALGPQYPLSKRATLGGEWEPLQPAFVRGRPELDRYTFDLRIAF
jgi:hypothetical protein